MTLTRLIVLLFFVFLLSLAGFAYGIINGIESSRATARCNNDNTVIKTLNRSSYADYGFYTYVIGELRAAESHNHPKVKKSEEAFNRKLESFADQKTWIEVNTDCSSNPNKPLVVVPFSESRKAPESRLFGGVPGAIPKKIIPPPVQ